MGPIGVAAPEWRLEQGDIVDLGVIASGDPARRARVRSMFRRVGVRFRSLIVGGEDGQWFYPEGSPPSTAERMAVYEREAGPLAVGAAREALSGAGVDAARVTHLVTASCTGFAAPGPDVEMIELLGLPRTTQRTHIGFMGCHAAANAVRVAHALAGADDRAVVLVACVELCSLHLQHQDVPERDVVNALFADGAAACVISASDGPGARVRGTASALWPGPPEQMSWRIGDHGFAMRLGRDVPEAIRSGVGPWVRAWLDAHGLGIGDIAGWAIHPGGPMVIDAVRDGLGLDEAACEPSRRILDAHGNMSSATLLYVLREIEPVRGPIVALAFGPGLTAEGLLLERP